MKYLKTRIKIYEQAIMDYKENNVITFCRTKDRINNDQAIVQYHGFCKYFNDIRIDIYNLPELMAQEPKTHYNKHYGFWWNPFIINRRIKALEDALELAKEIILK